MKNVVGRAMENGFGRKNLVPRTTVNCFSFKKQRRSDNYIFYTFYPSACEDARKPIETNCFSRQRTTTQYLVVANQIPRMKNVVGRIMENGFGLENHVP